ncbi:hypothetical protein KIW84_015527 [Lathyrus oleraceus]|uniref:DUF4283 domain-containing protein n=1 Tax=Pisum sativum TaxID=3888 RepID=A0A9D5BR19_PEA|nr:hypothetical protein KIW84_015527 [Pisum sativum]
MASLNIEGLSIQEEEDDGGFCFDVGEVGDESCDLQWCLVGSLDMEVALKGGPWTFDSHLLIIERVKSGVHTENTPLFHVDFWVQVHNLSSGLMLEKVERTMTNFIGSFVEYDRSTV